MKQSMGWIVLAFKFKILYILKIENDYLLPWYQGQWNNKFCSINNLTCGNLIFFKYNYSEFSQNHFILSPVFSLLLWSLLYYNVMLIFLMTKQADGQIMSRMILTLSPLLHYTLHCPRMEIKWTTGKYLSWEMIEF